MIASTVSPSRTNPWPKVIMSACSPKACNQMPSLSVLTMLINVNCTILSSKILTPILPCSSNASNAGDIFIAATCVRGIGTSLEMPAKMPISSLGMATSILEILVESSAMPCSLLAATSSHLLQFARWFGLA